MKPLVSKLAFAALASGLFLNGTLLHADDVTDSVNEALRAYKDRNYAAAAEALEAAAQMVRQMRGETFKDLLPAPPAGWTAEEPTSNAAGASLFGGGVTAERIYSKGDASLTVKIITDSPIMQGMMMMMGNPMFATADGGKLERIKGQRAIFKHGDGEGSVNIVVAGALLVQIEGSDVTAADLRVFAEAVDYAKLAEML